MTGGPMGTAVGDGSKYAALPAADSDTLSALSALSESSDDEGSSADKEVLREEEERERLLAGGNGLFGSIGKSGVKIGKKVRRASGRRKGVAEVVEMMGGKRLGMEEGGEFGLNQESDEEEEEEDEKEDLLGGGEGYWRKPRKPTLRRIFLFIASLITFLMVLIIASLSLSRNRFPSNTLAKDKMFSNGTHEFKPTTLLISLDGFRADFLYRDLSPTLTAFANSGLSPRFLIPSFPTATFPNHWTFVTGLYPESHGIVGNQFWDPELNDEFHNIDPEHSLQRKWWGGEPLWVTAERQGVKTAVHMWPGSEAAGGWGISYVDKFNGKEPLPRKTARILEWLDLPIGDRPQLIAAYVPNVDSVGHEFGPNSTESDAVIREVDTMMADILHGLVQRNLSEIVNIVVVSDHGMASTDNERLIYVDDIIDMSLIEHNDGWPLFGLRPYPHVNLTELYEKLQAEVSLNEKKGTKHWNVYLRDENMPSRWHFSNSQRIAPLWVIPDSGYAIVTRAQFDVDAPNPGKYEPAGLHGYDNTDPLMRAIFVARGPSFRHLHGSGRGWMFDSHSEEDDVRKGLVEEFGNWEVHRIICETLGIHEATGGTNATIENLGSFKLIDEGEAERPDLKYTTQIAFPTTTTTTTAVTEEGLITVSQTYTGSSRETDRPVPTRPPAPPEESDKEGYEGDDEELDETEEKDPSNMTPWEYLRWKAEKLKDQLDEWWEGVWSGGD